MSVCVSLAKVDSMLHKKCNQKDLATYFFKQRNWFMWKKKFVYVLIYLKIFKAVHKNIPRTHSSQQNKEAVLTAAAYFKVPTPIRSQGQ